MFINSVCTMYIHRCILVVPKLINHDSAFQTLRLSRVGQSSMITAMHVVLPGGCSFSWKYIGHDGYVLCWHPIDPLDNSEWSHIGMFQSLLISPDITIFFGRLNSQTITVDIKILSCLLGYQRLLCFCPFQFKKLLSNGLYWIWR